MHQSRALEMVGKGRTRRRHLSTRQAGYVRGVAEGKTKKQAALDAGYSLSTAENAAAKIERPSIRVALQEIIRSRLSPEKLVQRISEGLDAEETKFLRWKGKVIDVRRAIDWAERRKYVEFAAKYGGYYVEGQQARCR